MHFEWDKLVHDPLKACPPRGVILQHNLQEKALFIESVGGCSRQFLQKSLRDFSGRVPQKKIGLECNVPFVSSVRVPWWQQMPPLAGIMHYSGRKKRQFPRMHLFVPEFLPLVPVAFMQGKCFYNGKEAEQILQGAIRKARKAQFPLKRTFPLINVFSEMNLQR